MNTLKPGENYEKRAAKISWSLCPYEGEKLERFMEADRKSFCVLTHEDAVLPGFMKWAKLPMMIAG